MKNSNACDGEHFWSVLADEQQFQFLYFLEIRPQRAVFEWDFQANKPDERVWKPDSVDWVKSPTTQPHGQSEVLDK